MMIIEEQVHGLESEIYNCGDMNKIKKESDIQSVHGRIG